MENSEIKKLIENLKEAVRKSPTGVSFVHFNYKDADNRVTKRLFNIGVSYKNALIKDLMNVSNLRFEEPIKEQARVEIVKSLILSLKKEEELEQNVASAIEQIIAENSITFTEKEKESHTKKSEAQSETYIHICTGLKYHPVLQKLYINGMSVKSTIIEEGEVKADTRKPLTKAKDEIRKDMKSTKYRNLPIENLESSFKINGDTLELN